MKWGAHEVDGRVAAQNAVKIRAALRQSIDAKQLFDDYQTSQPHASGNMTQDRARARAWAIMNIRFNNDALATALIRLWAEAWVLGDDAAGEALFEGRQAMKAVEGTVDWSKWKAGDRVAALMLRKPKAFQKILDDMGIALKGMDKTSMDRIGTALADSIELGLSPTSAAKLINNAVGNPARALTIAITETSRVLNVAAVTRYKDAGLESMKWMTVLSVAGGSVACEKCAPNNGVVIKIGGSFPSGNDQPPAHPHCRCALLPDFSEYAAPTEHGVTTVPVPKPKKEPTPKAEPTPKLTVAQKLEIEYAHKPGQWSEALTGEAARFAMEQRRRMWNNITYNTRVTDKGWVNQGNQKKWMLDQDARMVKGKVVYTNGWTTVYFKESEMAGLEVSPQAILQAVDRQMEGFPLRLAQIFIENDEFNIQYPTKPNVRAMAVRGSLQGAKVWLKPRALTLKPVAITDRERAWHMKVASDTTTMDYVLAHEWGHAREKLAGNFEVAAADKKINQLIKQEGREYLSDYGKTNAAESYAECWAQWVLTEGKTTNPLTLAMAKEYDWK